MSDNSKQTIIESGTEFEGSLKSDCAITLSGKLTGDVSAPSLTVTPYGSVEGRVRVSELKVQGRVAGDIEADEVVLSGSVSDETVIRAKKLEVTLAQPENGIQVTFGNCDLNVGDMTDRSKDKKKDKKEKAATAEGKMIEAVGKLIK